MPWALGLSSIKRTVIYLRTYFCNATFLNLDALNLITSESSKFWNIWVQTLEFVETSFTWSLFYLLLHSSSKTFEITISRVSRCESNFKFRYTFCFIASFYCFVWKAVVFFSSCFDLPHFAFLRPTGLCPRHFCLLNKWTKQSGTKVNNQTSSD